LLIVEAIRAIPQSDHAATICWRRQEVKKFGASCEERDVAGKTKLLIFTASRLHRFLACFAEIFTPRKEKHLK
jgi:hypothetical protein